MPLAVVAIVHPNIASARAVRGRPFVSSQTMDLDDATVRTLRMAGDRSTALHRARPCSEEICHTDTSTGTTMPTERQNTLP